MQVPNARKRGQIIAAAARMFAARPFHDVHLADIARSAGVAKGTVYIYFKSKEELYLSLSFLGFSEMVDRLRAQLEPQPADTSPTASQITTLERIVAELVGFSFRHPDYFELTRIIGGLKGLAKTNWDAKRLELSKLIELAISDGVRAGDLADPRPELTAQCIMGMVRALMLFGPRGLDEETAVRQIVHLVRNGIKSEHYDKAIQGNINERRRKLPAVRHIAIAAQ